MGAVRITGGGLALALTAALLSVAPARAATGTTTRVSVASDGTGGNASSSDPDITPDGRFVAFVSGASDLVAGDTNNTSDVFVHDRATATTTRVSVGAGGVQGSGISSAAAISDSGRYVAFASNAANLVAGDTNGKSDVFVHDRKTGTTARVSVTSAGGEGIGPTTGGGAGSVAPDISADGRYVAFASSIDFEDGDDVTFDDIYVHDRQTATTARVSVPSPDAPSRQAAGKSSNPGISGDGRFVTFESEAPNLVTGDTNGTQPFNSSTGQDIFVHDRTTGITTRVNVASDGTQTDGGSWFPAISGDGRHVTFLAQATNLVAGDTNDAEDVFVHDRATATTTRVSVTNDGGGQSDASSSTFEPPAISPDGRYVAFVSTATNLVSGDANRDDDVFVRDRQSATTARVSVANDGTEANGDSESPSISADGTSVAFDSRAPDLAGGDLNTITPDVFVRDGDDTPVEPVKPVLSIGDVVIREGDEAKRAAVFTVTLSKPAATTVTASYATKSGTATKSSDFASKSGTLSIPAGVTGLTLKVPVAGDVVDEPNEAFTLKLSGVAGALAGDLVATASILDDDPETLTGWGLAVTDATVHEGDSGARNVVFTVSLSKPRPSEVTVSFATANGNDGNPALPHASAPGDFAPTSGTLTFAPGTTSLTVKVAITTDNATEATEQFRMILSNPSSGTYLGKGEGRGSIVDDD